MDIFQDFDKMQVLVSFDVVVGRCCEHKAANSVVVQDARQVHKEAQLVSGFASIDEGNSFGRESRQGKKRKVVATQYRLPIIKQ